MLQEGLAALLAANGAVSAIAGDRIFAVVASDDAAQYPCVSYALVGGTSDPTLDGPGMRAARLELNGFSLNSYAEAHRLREALIAAVDGWAQVLSDGTTISTA